MKQDIPVKIGDEVTLKCLSLGAKGDGIFKSQAFVIIAKNAIVGETYKLHVDKVLPTIAFATIVEE